MSQQSSPRGTFLKIADIVRAQVEDDDGMVVLPSAAEIMRDHGVSRGVALRVFGVLRGQGLAEPVPGGRWRVVRQGEQVDRRPLPQCLTDVITSDGLSVGSDFPSASALCERFTVSRPTVRRALDELHAAGLLPESKQGKQRTVLSLPNGEEVGR